MSIRIHWCLPGPLAGDAGGRREFIQEWPEDAGPLTVGAALAALEAAYPKLVERILDDRGQIREHVNLFVEEQPIKRGQGLQTPLAEGDTVTVLHAVSGGAALASPDGS